ncbi:MAG: asparagine synthase (glutamine-hydrolyzing) [Candidatus Omnitrophota bacterium]
MCGFACVVKKGRVNDKDIKDIELMNRAIRHRGPDSEGYYHSDFFAGASSRLAIIDLDERANQPMLDEEKRRVLFFNGEIYNYEEIRERLKGAGHVFRTESDTEVVLRSFAEWGAECVNKFVGMFAFAIFDLKNRDVYLFRDQIGIKPLYFYRDKDKFYFASEIRPFLKIMSLRPDYDRLVEYSIFGDVAGSQTLFKGIMELMPGHFIKLNRDLDCDIRGYFDMKDSFLNNGRRHSMVELEDLLNHSVVQHTKSDVGYGIQLSGGLDSSYVLSVLASNNKQRIETFSISLDGYKELDETKYQKSCAERYNTIHHGYSFRNSDFRELLAKSVWFFEYPLPHPNVVPTYIVCRKAQERKVKVLLSGEGGDEVFGGYRWYFEKKGDKKPDREELVYRASYNRPEAMRNIFNKLELDLSDRRRIAAGLKDDFSSLLLLDQTCHLRKWLQKQDRIGMACSIEMRVPYCNILLMNYVNGISGKDKTNSFVEPKYLLKKIAEKYLPGELVWRQKVGFAIPLEDWFRDEEGLRGFLGYLKDKTFVDRGIYDVRLTDKIMDDHLRGKANNGRLLWTLLNIELWHRIFVDRTMDF